MNVYELLDRLEELTRKARPVPLTTHVRVDRDELEEVVGLLRLTPKAPQAAP